MLSLMCGETLSHGEKRQVKQEPAARAPRGRRAASRGLRHLFASRPKRPDGSDRGRRPGSKNRLVFGAAERRGPNRLADEEHCEALGFDATQA
jgi:hypothetical protein